MANHLLSHYDLGGAGAISVPIISPYVTRVKRCLVSLSDRVLRPFHYAICILQARLAKANIKSHAERINRGGYATCAYPLFIMATK